MITQIVEWWYLSTAPSQPPNGMIVSIIIAGIVTLISFIYISWTDKLIDDSIFATIGTCVICGGCGIIVVFLGWMPAIVFGIMYALCKGIRNTGISCRSYKSRRVKQRKEKEAKLHKLIEDGFKNSPEMLKEYRALMDV